MIDAIIDLETMSTRSGAAITAIGVAVFKNRQLIDTFYVKVDLQSSIDSGGRVDASTIEWWLGQSEAARKEMFQPGVNIVQALCAMVQFLTKSPWIDEEITVYGKGAIFDIGILEVVLERFSIPFPWKYYNVQCFRTLQDLFHELPYDPPAIKHHALEDALAEGHHLMKIFSYLDELRRVYADYTNQKVAKSDDDSKVFGQ